MYKVIEHLRKKPDHHKQTIVFSASLAITLVIFAVWLTFIRAEFATVNSPGGIAEKDSPLVFIKESVANVYQGIMSDLKR